MVEAVDPVDPVDPVLPVVEGGVVDEQPANKRPMPTAIRDFAFNTHLPFLAGHGH
jgi:hypothetical protein